MKLKAKGITGVVAGVLVLAACSSGGGDEGDETTSAAPDPAEVSGTVTFWPYPLGGVNEASWWEPYIEDFQEEYPDVEIDVQMQAFAGREEALVTAIAGGTAPDVVYFNPDFIPRFVDEDLLVPLDDLRDDWDSFLPASLEAMSYDGTIYGSPQLMQAQASVCVVAVIEAAGVDCPTTWDDVREIAPILADAGYYVDSYAGTVTLNQTFYRYLWQAGGEVLNEDMTEAAFNGPEGLRALEFIKELVDNGWMPRDEISVLPAFEQSAMGTGQVAYSGGANVNSFRDVLGEDSLVVVEPMRDEVQVSTGSVGGWSIFNTTESLDASRAWVEYLGNVEFLDEFLPASGYFSPRSDTAELYADDPQLASTADGLQYLRTGVQHPAAREIMDLIRPHIQAVLLEGADPQTELDSAADEVNRIL